MSSASAYSFSTIAGHHLPEPLAREIDALAAEAAEPSIFVEAWMLGPALEHLIAEDVVVALVRDSDGRLAGLFPFESRRRFSGLPLRALSLVAHPHALLFTPLVSKHRSDEVVGAFLDGVAAGRAPARIVDLRNIAVDGPFVQALDRALQARRGWSRHVETRERALFKPRDNPDAGVSGKHRKELRRLERRLADGGELVYRIFEPGEPVQPWIEQFLALEVRGWKGQEGGRAFGLDEGGRAFFDSIITSAGERGRIQMFSMLLDGVPIAMKINFLLGDGGYAFKIAYDEDYAKYSPGVLLEVFFMTHIVEKCPEIAWVDSGARSDHPMINRLWTDRRRVGDHLLAHGYSPARLIVRHWWLNRALRKYVHRG
jgi:CelD/BcsL family acetyltransferase involved in cellulose biosynthesis